MYRINKTLRSVLPQKIVENFWSKKIFSQKKFFGQKIFFGQKNFFSIWIRDAYSALFPPTERFFLATTL